MTDQLPASPRVALRIYSLRTKLLALSLTLVVLPGLVFAFLSFSSARRALEASIGRQLAEVSHDVADDFEVWFATETEDIGTWATQEVMRDLLVGDIDKRISRFLTTLQQSDPSYVRLVCTDADGTAVASTAPSDVGGKSVAALVARAIAGETAMSGPVSEGSQRLLRFVAPVRHPDQQDRIVGALLLEIDWSAAGTMLERVRGNTAALGLDLELTLLDQDRRVIVAVGNLGSKDRRATEIPTDQWPELAARIATHPVQGFLFERSADALLGYTALNGPASAWKALAVQPADNAFAPIVRMLRAWVILLAFVVILAGTAATVMADRMVRPLQRLTQATREIGREATPVLLAVETRDEIGELAASFNAMNDRLDRAQKELLVAAKFAFIGEMAAGIAHEIRTPLSVLRSSAQVLARSLPDAKGSQAELVEVIIEEVDRLDRVVAGLLQIARPQPRHLVMTDLRSLLQRAIDFATSSATTKGITLEHELGPAPILVRCDPDQIYQVILNLVVNAIQFTPAGGSVSITTFSHGDEDRGFEVRDSGPGISAENVAKVFTPFFTTRSGGTGLGLALVDRMVRAHQGSVSVTSTLGHGATFRVQLPASGDDS